MLRLLILVLEMTLFATQTRAAVAPTHIGTVITQEVEDNDARSAARHLTQQRNWQAIAQLIARGDPSLKSAVIRGLLDYAPKHRVRLLQRALRARMKKDALLGLTALSLEREGPFSVSTVCGSADARWKHQIKPALLKTHNTRFALQRQACLKALKPFFLKPKTKTLKHKN